MGKKKKKKLRKAKYDPITTLSPICFHGNLEALAQDLYEKACKGSQPVWEKFETSEPRFPHNSDLSKEFYKLSHQGMRAAQDTMLQHILANPTLDYQHKLLFRGIADTMAWSMIDDQLCYARRLYKEQCQPSLYCSSLDTVIVAADSIMDEDEDKFALISDLTSFVQVGDLLTFSPNEGLGMAEVKSGKVNHRIHDFIQTYSKTQCERLAERFFKHEDNNTIKQMGRMMRQNDRMLHFSEVMKSGLSIDPDTNEKIHIPDEFIEIETWNEVLIDVLEQSDTKSFALDIIDSCLFVASYSGTSYHAGHLLFNTWFDEFGGTEACPRSKLSDSLLDPLALPIFQLNISEKHKFDILFGRKTVCVGIVIEKLLEECKKQGWSVREATNKEKGKLIQNKHLPYMHKGKPIFIGNGLSEMVLMEGIFLRSLYHGQKPISILKHYLANLNNIQREQ
ncbi:hypothetical protein CXF86_19170 [Shewanella sp. GutCb]|uniref:hypothetical protein n=1 Tax=Shewanella sp. GutCb TaxID=2058315 RepID=UPI000C7A57B8|nr:hypothetical protein [Shewanella sp. GutCb]PKG73172.1 hypothetical protein CXF86_19170 [Shewanella sp. GutCb]